MMNQVPPSPVTFSDRLIDHLFSLVENQQILKRINAKEPLGDAIGHFGGTFDGWIWEATAKGIDASKDGTSITVKPHEIIDRAQQYINGRSQGEPF